MVEFEYLYKGLCGMARAHLANNMTGHLGAAVVAGYFCGEDLPDLDNTVYAGIEGELDRIMHGEEKWFDPNKVGMTAPELFEPMPDGPPQAERIEVITEALAGNIDKTRESGHNVIFTSIAVRALRDHPAFATESIIDGIRLLIAGFNQSGPGRGYYGKEQGWIQGADVVLTEDTDFPPYQDQMDMANVVMDELIATAPMHRQGFGGLWHVINHAAALTELSRFGYENLAKQGLAAHHHHVRLWRSLPDLQEELGPMQKSKQDPRTAEYWKSGELRRDSARLTHRIKTLYGFHALSRLITDAGKRKAAERELLYLM
jgi:hypothetical protein